MRLIAIIPWLCSVAAFVLSMLCMFAGNKPSFMEDYDLLLLNTSRLGYLKYNTTDADTGLSWLNSIIDNVTSGIENEINIISNDIAIDLGLHDFYAWHMLDYCEGYYEPNSTAKHVTRNVTSCSNQTSMYDFNVTAIMDQQLVANVTLGDLDWPSGINSSLHDISTAAKAMFVLYCIGIGFTGLVVILGFIAIFLLGRLIGFVNFLLSLLAFVTLLIASAIATAASIKIADAVNQYGASIGLAAHRGGKFMALTWVATGLMFVAAFAWIFECCLPRLRNRRAQLGTKSA